MSAAGRPVALVTGATGGVGRALARRLAAAGWGLALIARNGDALDALADELDADTWAAVADVRDAAALTAAVTDLVERAGRLDLAVANAGVLEEGRVEDTELESWTRVLDTNLTGTFVTIQAALPAIRRARGRVVVLSSLAGRRGRPGLAAYSAAKAGVIALAESLAAEVQADGVGVHTIVLGPTATSMLVGDWIGRHQLDPADVADTIAWLGELPSTVLLPELELRPARIPENERMAVVRP